MLGVPSAVITELKEKYPEGTRVELVKMDDPYRSLEPGKRGTVTGVDDIGTIHVNWDCGSSLGIAYGEDEIKKLNVCPNCHREYSDHPAISRTDNKTLICPECGTIEVLSCAGLRPEEKKEIYEAFHHQKEMCS